MAHQSERNIPHLRDIFGFHDKRSAKDREREKDKDRGCAEIGGYGGRGGDWDDKCADSSSISTNGGNDSAISVGSTSEEDLAQVGAAGKKKKKRREGGGGESDVKHLERHLSMKKTIRKKIMRDLQQAFVEDPNEFRVEDISHEQLKAELNLQSLSFGGAAKKKGKKASGESNFLDFLRTGSGDGKCTASVAAAARPEDADSGHGSPPRARSPPLPPTAHGHGRSDDDDEDNRKVSFWRRFTMKGRTKR